MALASAKAGESRRFANVSSASFAKDSAASAASAEPAISGLPAMAKPGSKGATARSATAIPAGCADLADTSSKMLEATACAACDGDVSAARRRTTETKVVSASRAATLVTRMAARQPATRAPAAGNQALPSEPLFIAVSSRRALRAVFERAGRLDPQRCASVVSSASLTSTSLSCLVKADRNIFRAAASMLQLLSSAAFRRCCCTSCHSPAGKGGKSLAAST
mmetsp:Transcript_81267/g.143343  ORF Transcript_81267/g.143343 Transcript_81267/m.143343 type:complete len:222 (-) Transcript_81267:573-1238(-)